MGGCYGTFINRVIVCSRADEKEDQHRRKTFNDKNFFNEQIYKTWIQKVSWARKMIKNFKDIVVLLITTGVLALLGVIIIGDYIVALEENRPVDESVITLMKMSVTGLIGVIGGYIGGSK